MKNTGKKGISNKAAAGIIFVLMLMLIFPLCLCAASCYWLTVLID